MKLTYITSEYIPTWMLPLFEYGVDGETPKDDAKIYESYKDSWKEYVEQLNKDAHDVMFLYDSETENEEYIAAHYIGAKHDVYVLGSICVEMSIAIGSD